MLANHQTKPVSINQADVSSEGQPNSSLCTSYGTLEALRGRLLRASLQDGSCIKDLVISCLTELPKIAKYELFSVYLLDRRGEIERVGLNRSSGGPLPEVPLLKKEEWGGLLPSRGGSKYADAFIATPAMCASDPLRAPFESCVGPLQCVVRLPLNGSNQTFGLLEAAHPEATLCEQDLHKLIFVASSLASAITAWRARNDSMAPADVMRVLAGANIGGDGPEQVESIFEKAVSALLNRLLDYRAVVLRMGLERAGPIVVKAKDRGLSWQGWHDRDFQSGPYLAERVFETGEPVVLEDVELRTDLFANIVWLRNSGLRSCVCYPLKTGGKTIGTLTAYTGFRKTFSPLDGLALSTITDALAVFWERIQSERKRLETEERLENVREGVAEERVSGARLAAIFPYVSLLHQAKNSWVEVLNLIEKKGPSAIPSVASLAQRMSKLLSEQRILQTRDTETIDVQEAVSEIVRWKKQDLKRWRIDLALDVKAPIPLIRMPRALFNEVIYNLLSNAEWAIRKAARKAGHIEISVFTETVKSQEDLVIDILDDGVGVPKDKLTEIFQRGFTTFADSGGTGLGLFLALEIVQDYNGVIRVDSKFGESARFSVRLPLSWVRP